MIQKVIINDPQKEVILEGIVKPTLVFSKNIGHRIPVQLDDPFEEFDSQREFKSKEEIEQISKIYFLNVIYRNGILPISIGDKLRLYNPRRLGSDNDYNFFKIEVVDGDLVKAVYYY